MLPLSPILYYGSSISLGFLVAYFLAWPIALFILAAVIIFGFYMLWAWRNAELGIIIGWIAAWWSGIFTAVFVVTAFFAYGNYINLSWIFR